MATLPDADQDLTSSPLFSPLELLGWSEFFADQVQPGEADLIPRRVASVHRARIEAIDVTGPVGLELPANTNTADFAVGDWVLADPLTDMLMSRLDRKSVFQRRTEGGAWPATCCRQRRHPVDRDLVQRRF
ncbi:ribosome biogenesis GTPase [Rhizobium tibeticum]|uniref:GTPase RsgA n=1 Tax=Rhizobium tibeticum TaxID=501024 RepID=A0A1H8MUF4_9HYPH|nr:GTPase RsgA [Rhizobium tibeticum]SEO20878.1 ribosome biogenesis GTPase [Rhizobium tibeticum]